MLHFGLNMPFFYMALYGSIMILVVLLLRALLKNRLPAFVFPVLWCVVLLRLLVPFSVSSPLSLPVPAVSFLSRLFPEEMFYHEDTYTSAIAEGSTSYQNPITMKGSAAQSVANEGVSEGAADVEALGEIIYHDDPFVDDSIGYQNRLEGTTGENAITEANISHGTEGSTVMEASGVAWSYNYQNLAAHRFLIRKVLPALYILGLAVVIFILGWQKYCYGKKFRGSLLIEHNETINSMLRELSMGHVLVFTNDEIASPLACGLLNPRIYLPTRMDFQNTLLLHHILAHETMHIKRRDNWLKAVMLAALCLNWYNPLVWVMSKSLAADLERACDADVLKGCDEDGRKSYAYSLLAMAITGGRSTLLYSAFSKTEVEKRVKGIVHYKKATAFTLVLAVLFLLGSTVAFASGGQAPFSSYLTSYCASDSSRWGVRAELARDISLGENAQIRAEDAIFSVLRADSTDAPEILEQEIKAALAAEFGVERKAFLVDLSLCLGQEEKEAEYAPWGLTCGEDGFWLYEGKTIRIFEDKMLGSYQSHEEGDYDISVQRDRLGNVISVTAWQEGDHDYDERTRKIKENRRGSYGHEESWDYGFSDDSDDFHYQQHMEDTFESE